MALVMTVAPAAEPIALAEAKAHLRIDSDDEGALVEALIGAARMHVERALGLALVTQTRRPSARRFSCSSPIGSSGASRSCSAPRRRRFRRLSQACCFPIAG
jgi:hypothetical protein